MKNPYDEFICDEASGIDVEVPEHQVWAEGYDTGYREGFADCVIKLRPVLGSIGNLRPFIDRIGLVSTELMDDLTKRAIEKIKEG